MDCVLMSHKYHAVYTVEVANKNCVQTGKRCVVGDNQVFKYLSKGSAWERESVGVLLKKPKKKGGGIKLKVLAMY